MIFPGGHQRRSKVVEQRTSPHCRFGPAQKSSQLAASSPFPVGHISRRTDSAQIQSFPRTTSAASVDLRITPHDVRTNIVALGILKVAFGNATCAQRNLRWSMCKGRDLSWEAITTGMTRWCVDGRSRVVKDLQLAVGICYSRSGSAVTPVGIVSFPPSTPQLVSRSF